MTARRSAVALTWTDDVARVPRSWDRPTHIPRGSEPCLPAGHGVHEAKHRRVSTGAPRHPRRAGRLPCLLRMLLRSILPITWRDRWAPVTWRSAARRTTMGREGRSLLTWRGGLIRLEEDTA